MPLNAHALALADNLAQRYPALQPTIATLCDCVQVIVQMHRHGGRLLICGNGGSAADAQHIVGELVKSFGHPRKLTAAQQAVMQQVDATDGPKLATKLQQGVSAMALSDNAALLTAIANDTAAELVFAQQVFVHGRKGDVLLGISTSGNSLNVIHALQVARALGLTTLGLCGSKACRMDSICDHLLKAPATETYQIQEYHLPLYHALCLMIEAELYAGSDTAV